jgi:hypothetical protein
MKRVEDDDEYDDEVLALALALAVGCVIPRNAMLTVTLPICS